MNRHDLEKRMRIFERANDRMVLPGVSMVARLDGRGFTKLTKSREDFTRPFDPRFAACMRDTLEHLMLETGMSCVFGYAQSDEISLLFDDADESFGRRVPKLVSVLAGEASARFSRALDLHAVFDCRISELPKRADVVDYFRWRQSDCERNSLSAHAYWALRHEGATEQEATRRLEGATPADKHELLHARGIHWASSTEPLDSYEIPRLSRPERLTSSRPRSP